MRGSGSVGFVRAFPVRLGFVRAGLVEGLSRTGWLALWPAMTMVGWCDISGSFVQNARIELRRRVRSCAMPTHRHPPRRRRTHCSGSFVRMGDLAASRVPRHPFGWAGRSVGWTMPRR